MTTTIDTPARKRGRPRDPNIDRDALDAARGIVARMGVHAASMTAIADACRAGKPSLYLRWRNADALVEDAYQRLDIDLLHQADELRELLDRLARQPDGAFMVEMVVHRWRQARR